MAGLGVLAAYQVQGVTMPPLVFDVLVIALLCVAGAAFFSVCWEVVTEVRRWRERRETSTEWIASEPPGLLDYGPDMLRANKRFLQQMGALTKDMQRIGELRNTIAEKDETTRGAIAALRGYRDSTRSLADANYSRSQRVSGHMLADQLDAMAEVLVTLLKEDERLLALLDQRLAGA